MSIRLALIALLVAGCGDDDGTGTADGAVDGDGSPIVDADPNAPDASPMVDAFVPPGCMPGSTECTDCDDNDGDGLVDGYDPGCISADDRLEGSFATGIPGDNMDLCNQDCFFDGDSGAGNDGCDIPTCCFFANLADCPDQCQSGFDPADCMTTTECEMTCAPATPPGCDCFGCCTICDDVDCYTVYTHPEVAPDCTQESLADPTLCPPCVPSAECGTPCGDCILCPGQDPSDLPPGCTGAECPDGATECTSTADCTATQFCSNGCCLEQIG
jgi:hypothetical protein